ncbi:hypothetical protein S83_057854, partial [Arachis hypogaea]
HKQKQHKKVKNIQVTIKFPEIIYLTRSDDDVVNGNEDELDEEANESHNHNSDFSTNSNL